MQSWHLPFANGQKKWESESDPLTILVVTGVLAIVAIFAAWIPAMRATRVDPLSSCGVSSLDPSRRSRLASARHAAASAFSDISHSLQAW
jgi:hypothetical protein